MHRQSVMLLYFLTFGGVLGFSWTDLHAFFDGKVCVEGMKFLNFVSNPEIFIRGKRKIFFAFLLLMEMSVK